MNKERQFSVKRQTALQDLKLPDDLRTLDHTQCIALCESIRRILISTVLKTGGHLASNLGVVELTLALHRNFHSPQDRIIWDVGHQAYVHKILTGRVGEFQTLRQENGLSGFPKPSESPHDCFITGHSSTAVSAAFGIAEAFRIQGDPHYAVAVVGDGAMTGGLFYEGLNNAGKSRSKLIVILNDNNQAISKNVGAIAKYLSKIRSSTGYVRAKWSVERVIGKTPAIGSKLVSGLKNTKDRLRKNIVQTTLFEDLGFVYLGPVDGHDLEALDEVLSVAKSYQRPVVVHVQTIKGKGYAPAEENPGEYHGVPRTSSSGNGLSRIDLDEKNPEVSVDECYSTVFGKALTALGKRDQKLCAVTAAMKYGTGLQFFAAAHPDRFFDVGIAEQHAVTFCSALASMGMLPVFAVYSTFLQRSYDQILHDTAIADNHIVLAVDRAGIVGEDGETHQGMFDIPMLTTIPNVKIYSPASYPELEVCLSAALYQDQGIAAVRYPRGSQPVNIPLPAETVLSHQDGGGILLITFGRISANASKAIRILHENGTACSLLRLVTVFPIPETAIRIAMQYQSILFLEESEASGGIGEKMAAKLLYSGWNGSFRCRAAEGFIRQSTADRCIEQLGLSTDDIVRLVKETEQNDDRTP
ncbi:MAG: 1-deoxy-D-xylulose-5-phosphate synthase [Oscillospiraceae bacterium]|nr:1-deoxy-D-xylulose-5-phosphate synthase [Oscillospiraceae bacterium]